MTITSYSGISQVTGYTQVSIGDQLNLMPIFLQKWCKKWCKKWVSVLVHRF